MKKTLYLMRHGQTLFNVRRKIQGWCDAPLTKVGIEQAKIAANYFKEKNIKFDFAYTSTSERASDTLELITNKPYARLKGLKEWNFGTFEGESEDLNPKLPYKDFFVQYGGESEGEVKDRISATLLQIMEKDDHNNVLVVSHAGAIAQFYLNWEKYAKVIKNDRFHNCCILKFEFEDGIFTLLEINNQDFSNIVK